MTVLANEPLGSFMVRRSETQPGALALSVRVPPTFHPLGITHYIIVRVEGGHQIKVRPVCHRNNEGPDKTLLLTVHSQLNIINDPEFISFPDRRMVCKLPWVPVFYFFHWDPQWIFNFRILPTVDTCSKFCEDTLYLQVKTIFRVSWRCTPVWPPWSLTTASCRSCCPLLWISTDITPPALTWTMTTPPSRTSPS